MTLLDPEIWTSRLFSGGWTEPSGGDASVVEPATGAQLGRIGVANAEDVDAAAFAAGRRSASGPSCRTPSALRCCVAPGWLGSNTPAK